MGNEKKRILILDDEQGILNALKAYFEDMDWNVHTVMNGRAGWEILRVDPSAFDLVLVDLNMPVMDGYTFIERAVALDGDLPIVVLSGVGVVNDALRAIRNGAWDFITKPVTDFAVLEHVLGKALDRARLIRENRNYQLNLEKLVKERTLELEESRRQVMARLSRAAEFKDNETGRHVIRTGKISVILGERAGLSEEICDMLNDCVPLHDVGKIGIPDAILLKPGRLDEEEWKVMRRHCEYGYKILGPLSREHDDAETNRWLKLARTVAMCHHERWDGGGYPAGLKGEEIPIEARIVSVVDVYDALRSERPYKPELSEEKSAGILEKGAGTQFDPLIIEGFLDRRKEIDEIWDRWKG